MLTRGHRHGSRRGKSMPEEAVAQGACHSRRDSRSPGNRRRQPRLAQAVINRLRSVNTIDVNSHSLGVKITDPNNREPEDQPHHDPQEHADPVPASRSGSSRTRPNQQRIHVCVLEGDAIDPDACTTIGDFRVVNLPPNLPAGSPVEVTYEYDKNGRISAHGQGADDGNRERKTEIVRDSGLDSEGVDAFETPGQPSTAWSDGSGQSTLVPSSRWAHRREARFATGQQRVESPAASHALPSRAWHRVGSQAGAWNQNNPSMHRYLTHRRMDVYKEWLGIPEGPRPPDHYELLRCVRFEDDIDKVRANYKKLNGHVRKYATGQYSVQSQELLNELAKAMLCLTDPERKREYDESLGREFEAGTRRLRPAAVARRAGQARGHLARPAEGSRGVRRATRTVDPRRRRADEARQLRTWPPRRWPCSWGTRTSTWRTCCPRTTSSTPCPTALVKKHSFLPLFIDDDRLLVACVDKPEHELEEELRLRYGVPDAARDRDAAGHQPGDRQVLRSRHAG